MTNYGDIDLESQVRLALAEKTMPRDLLEEVSTQIDMQWEWVESGELEKQDVSYNLAFEDVWNAALSWDSKKLLKQIKDWLIAIDYYISHPHPRWVSFTQMGSNPKIKGTEFRYKKKAWQIQQYDQWGK